MAVRPIDGNALIEWFRPYLHTGEAIPPDVVVEDIRSMPTLTPPNEALTIEQLKTMDEEWVMIKAFDREISGTMPAIIKDEFATTLCKLGAKAVVPDLCEVHFPFSEYRKTWIAYRRPPERQEGDADHA